ncbi:MAG: hypothetical protein ACR2JD_04010 [Nocardioides sp.]
MSVVSAVLVRAIVLGAGIGAYTWLAPRLMPDDDGLGAGLLAFALIIVLTAIWGLVDGRRRDFNRVAMIWLVTVGWSLGLAVNGADSSMTTLELLRADLVLLPFTFGLVAAPALVGGAIGQAFVGRPR